MHAEPRAWRRRLRHVRHAPPSPVHADSITPEAVATNFIATPLMRLRQRHTRASTSGQGLLAHARAPFRRAGLHQAATLTICIASRATTHHQQLLPASTKHNFIAKRRQLHRVHSPCTHRAARTWPFHMHTCVATLAMMNMGTCMA